MLLETEKSLVNIAKGAGVIFTAQVVGVFLGIINQIILGRILGPENYGLFNLGITIIIIFLPFTTFGINSAIRQFIPHYLAKKRNDKVKGGIFFLIKFSLTLGIIISFLIFFLSPYISENIFHDKNLENVLKILCISIPFNVILLIGTNISQSFKISKYKLYLDILVMKITSILLFLILLYYGYRLFGALVGYIGGITLVAIAYIYIIFRKYIPSLSSERSDIHVKGELLSIGWPLFFAGFSYLFIEKTDKTLIGVFMNSSDVGIYTAAYAIASIALFVLPAFQYIFLPTISEFFGKKDFENIKDLFRSISKWIFLITFPLIIYISLFSKNTINLIYGVDYTSGAPVLIILLFGIAMNGLTGLTGQVLVGMRKTRLNLWTEILGAITNVGLNIFLIPLFGMVGAAIGTSISLSVRNLTSLGFVYKELKTHPYDRSYLKIIFSSILALTPVLLFLNFILKSNYLFILFMPLFFGIYLFLLFVLKSFNDYDKMILRVILNKIGLKKLSNYLL